MDAHASRCSKDPFPILIKCKETPAHANIEGAEGERERGREREAERGGASHINVR